MHYDSCLNISTRLIVLAWLASSRLSGGGKCGTVNVCEHLEWTTICHAQAVQGGSLLSMSAQPQI